MYACIVETGGGFFAVVCAPSNATANSYDPPPPRSAKEPEPWQWGSGSYALRVGWVVGIGGCIAGCAHPLEKSATDSVRTSIHRLPSL